MRVAYLDCFSGISGDMCLGALLDAGLDLLTLEEGLKGLALPGYTLKANRVLKQGISAVKADVDISNEGPSHRGLAEIYAIIQQSVLPQQVKENSQAVFKKLGEAEAKVHGVSVEAVHLHEVGAIDAIVDIVGTVLGLYLLGVSQIYASPLPLGGGVVSCDHGLLPVPVPATLELVKGIPTAASLVQAELVTPTGAALVASLVKEIGPLPPMTITATGYGAGAKDFSHPNVLRLIIGELAEAEVLTGFDQGSVAVIEATIDDMNPEFFSSLGDSLFEAGALDYYYTPVYMKKQRPAFKVTILSSPEASKRIAAQLMQQTTTLGCRIRKENRLIAPRELMTVTTPFGNIEVKFSPSTKTVAPEYDSCANQAKAFGVPVKLVYDAAKAKAWKLLQE